MDRVSTANPPSPPDIGDLRVLARGLRELFEIAATTLAEDAQSSELARRVTGYLGCERPPVLRDAHFAAVLAEMNDERHSLTRSLLGVDTNSGGPPAPVRYRRRR